ncbi:MAG: hypothetical protein D6761_01930 [Candidatus Dadabacteria bacterium]|nr:MAG: hypothetical protein D6761_01930 [Candidatus Dadabacteria bacterium]
MTRLDQIGQSLVRASQQELLLAGSNLANASSDGYYRRIGVSQSIALNRGEHMAGVEFQWQGSARDDFDVRVLRSAVSADAAAALEQDNLDALATIVAPVGGYGIEDAAGEFRAALSAATVQPENDTIRRNVTNSAQTLVSRIREVAARIDELTQKTRKDVDLNVKDLRTRLEELARVEMAAQSSGEPVQGELLESRDRTLAEIAQLVGISVDERPDGTVAVRARSGALLYDRGEIADIERSGDKIVVRHGGMEAQLYAGDGGELGAALSVINDWQTTTRTAANDFAAALADAINSLQAGGFDRSGTPGAAVFTYDPASPASTLALTGVDTDPGAWALGSVDGHDGGNILPMEAALDGALNNVWREAAQAVMFGAQSAAQESEHRQLALNNAKLEVAETSGVSLEDEATRMSQAQLMYQAGLRVLQIEDENMQTLLQLGAR